MKQLRQRVLSVDAQVCAHNHPIFVAAPVKRISARYLINDYHADERAIVHADVVSVCSRVRRVRVCRHEELQEESHIV